MEITLNNMVQFIRVWVKPFLFNVAVPVFSLKISDLKAEYLWTFQAKCSMSHLFCVLIQFRH